MATAVRFSRVDDHGGMVEVGVLGHDGGRWFHHGPGWLANLIHLPISRFGLRRPVTAADPAAFLSALRGQYTSPYLCAGDPFEVGSPAGEKGLHTYGSVQIVVPDDLRKEITDWALEAVPDFHLGKGGREARPHVTVKYGFKDASPATVQGLRALLGRHGPFPVRLGGLSLFRGNPDGDVLKVDVESADLRELNAQLGDQFDCYDKYPEYHPHLTVAYLVPAAAPLYLEEAPPFLGRVVQVDKVEWSAPDGTLEEIPLSFWHRTKALDPKRPTPPAGSPGEEQGPAPAEEEGGTGEAVGAGPEEGGEAAVPAPAEPEGASPPPAPRPPKTTRARRTPRAPRVQAPPPAPPPSPPQVRPTPPAPLASPAPAAGPSTVPAEPAAPQSPTPQVEQYAELFRLRGKPVRAHFEVGPLVVPGELDAALERLFPQAGGDVDKATQQLFPLVSAVDGAHVEVHDAGEWPTGYTRAHGLHVRVGYKSTYDADRFVGVDQDGNSFIENQSITLGRQGKGKGTTIFARQVAHAVDQGFKYIQCTAAGSFGWGQNGYYTWPRLGYDQAFNTLDRRHYQEVLDRVSEVFPPEVDTVLKLMATKPNLSRRQEAEIRGKLAQLDDSLNRPRREYPAIFGHHWWQVHGRTLPDAKFDLTPGSQSLAVLSAYLRELEAGQRRGQKAMPEDVGAGDRPARGARAEEIELSDLEEQALTAVWDTIGRAGLRGVKGLHPESHGGGKSPKPIPTPSPPPPGPEHLEEGEGAPAPDEGPEPQPGAPPAPAEARPSKPAKAPTPKPPKVAAPTPPPSVASAATPGPAPATPEPPAPPPAEPAQLDTTDQPPETKPSIPSGREDDVDWWTRHLVSSWNDYDLDVAVAKAEQHLADAKEGTADRQFWAYMVDHLRHNVTLTPEQEAYRRKEKVYGLLHQARRGEFNEMPQNELEKIVDALGPWAGDAFNDLIEEKRVYVYGDDTGGRPGLVNELKKIVDSAPTAHYQEDVAKQLTEAQERHAGDADEWLEAAESKLKETMVDGRVPTMMNPDGELLPIKDVTDREWVGRTDDPAWLDTEDGRAWRRQVADLLGPYAVNHHSWPLIHRAYAFATDGMRALADRHPDSPAAVLEELQKVMALLIERQENQEYVGRLAGHYSKYGADVENYFSYQRQAFQNAIYRLRKELERADRAIRRTGTDAERKAAALAAEEVTEDPEVARITRELGNRLEKAKGHEADDERSVSGMEEDAREPLARLADDLRARADADQLGNATYLAAHRDPRIAEWLKHTFHDTTYGPATVPGSVTADQIKALAEVMEEVPYYPYLVDELEKLHPADAAEVMERMPGVVDDHYRRVYAPLQVSVPAGREEEVIKAAGGSGGKLPVQVDKVNYPLPPREGQVVYLLGADGEPVVSGQVAEPPGEGKTPNKIRVVLRTGGTRFEDGAGRSKDAGSYLHGYLFGGEGSPVKARGLERYYKAQYGIEETPPPWTKEGGRDLGAGAEHKKVDPVTAAYKMGMMDAKQGRPPGYGDPGVRKALADSPLLAYDAWFGAGGSVAYANVMDELGNAVADRAGGGDRNRNRGWGALPEESLVYLPYPPGVYTHVHPSSGSIYPLREALAYQTMRELAKGKDLKAAVADVLARYLPADPTEPQLLAGLEKLANDPSPYQDMIDLRGDHELGARLRLRDLAVYAVDQDLVPDWMEKEAAAFGPPGVRDREYRPGRLADWLRGVDGRGGYLNDTEDMDALKADVDLRWRGYYGRTYDIGKQYEYFMQDLRWALGMDKPPQEGQTAP